MKIDYKHTWAIPRSAWYIRFYLWLWEAKARDITFCKLFWGYLLIWIGIPTKLFVVTVRALIRAKRGLVREKPKAPKPPKPNQFSPIEAVANGFTRFNMWLHRPLISRLALIFVVEFAMAVLIATGFGLVKLGALVGSNIDQISSALLDGSIFVGLLLGVMAVSVSMVVGLALLIIRGKVDRLFIWLATSFGRGTKRGALGFRDVMLIGYRAVKSNTCPRVEVIEE